MRAITSKIEKPLKRFPYFVWCPTGLKPGVPLRILKAKPGNQNHRVLGSF